MIDFGLVDAIDAEAIGQPGQRRFRLRVRSGQEYAALWMEKESVAALGRSFSALLAERSTQRGRPAADVEAWNKLWRRCPFTAKQYHSKRAKLADHCTAPNTPTLKYPTSHIVPPL